MNSPPQPHDIIGAIDAGSNAIRFSLFRLNTRLTPVLQSRKRYPVRLGAGTFTSGAMADADIDQAILAFREIAQIRHDQNLIALPAVATSAIREATNCDAFLARVKTETGIDLKVITGDEEASLAALGVASPANRKRENLIIDIGGGSTEIIKVRPGGEIAESVSLRLGAVRLAEQAGMPDSYEDSALSKMRELILKTISENDLKTFASPPQTTCIGGTACALASAVQSTQDGGASDKILLSDVEDTSAHLAKLSVSTMARNSCIDEERARIIIPGAYILMGILSHLDIKEFIVSDAGVREGMVSEYLSKVADSCNEERA